MKLSQVIHERLHRDTPKEAVIKWKAHAATTACAALLVPSACAFYLRHLGLEENEPGWVSFASRVWEVHAACALLALFFWITEKPRLTKYVSDHKDIIDVDGDGR